MSSIRTRRTRLAVASIAGAMILASCATPTPYRPAVGVGEFRTGYFDQPIEANRYRVSFAGNSLTSRETVERYLLYRAAQLTLEQGYEHFVLVDRDTERRTRTYVDPGPRASFGFGFGYWNPYWRYYGPRFGWRTWDPFWGDPFWDRNIDVRTVDRYEAIAEIVLGRGPKPADNVRAFDAREVIDRLGPTIVLPQPR